MKISLSDRFSYRRLLRFTLPSVIMMIFSSIYGVVDGFFISNFAGKTAFAAVNFIIPFLMILGTLGFMFGAGGSALIAKTLGEGDKERANRIFSLLIYVSIALGVVLAALGIVFLPSIAKLLGAQGKMLEDCVLYGRIILISLPAFILQMEFQSFFVTAERPNIGLAVTVAAGLTNIILDLLLVGFLNMGITGAAIATALSQTVGGVVPIFYFALRNSSLLRLMGTRIDIPALIKVCSNGSSELMSNISFSLVSMLYNVQLLHYAGENGVSAYGVLMYVGMIFNAVFIGYSIGSAPIIGYHFGAKNTLELSSLLKKSCVIVATVSLSMVALSYALSYPLSFLFVGYDASLFELTLSGFKIYSFSFLFMGFAIFFSGFFTALNDGLTSAIISFLRTIVFQCAAVIILPMLFSVDGIWWSIVVAELMAMAVSLFFLFFKRKRYNYF